MSYKLVASEGRLGHDLVMQVKLQKNVLYMASVSSSLKFLKNKGEGDGRETFQDACGADKVQRSYRFFFMLLEDQKLLSGEN